MNPIVRSFFCVQSVIIALSLGCGGDDPLSKQEARALNGLGPNGEDLCRLHGWYEDSECDDWCALLDPVCPTIDSGVDAGSGDAALDASVSDAGDAQVGDAAIDAYVPAEGGTDGGVAQPLGDGAAYGTCGTGPFVSRRGPGRFTGSFSGPALTSHTWAFELDEGQTIEAHATPHPIDGLSEITLSDGPCKFLMVRVPLTTHTAVARENVYVTFYGRFTDLEIVITGAPSTAPCTACTTCDTSTLTTVALGTPFAYGSPNNMNPQPIPTPNTLSAQGATSCTGIRHLGNDTMWRVQLAAGQKVHAYAINYGSSGPDPLAFYLVRDCSDLTQCVASSALADGAIIDYVAPANETLYLVLDRFTQTDRTADHVTIEVTQP
jgi:hypothetical protein